MPKRKKPRTKSSKTAKESTPVRIARLVSTGAALVTLTEKAVAHLPYLIEVLHHASTVFFLNDDIGISSTHSLEGESKAEVLGLGKRREEPRIAMKVSPHELPDTIKFAIESRNWNHLVATLSIGFDVKLNSGDVPPELLTEIMNMRSEVLKELAALGYTPHPMTAGPVFSRTIDA